MKFWRILCGVSCLACAAANTAGPSPETPDAAEPQGTPMPTPPEGTPPAPDAQSSPPVTPPVTADADVPPTPPGDASPPPITGEPDPGNYTCTLIIGINATAEWYGK